MPYRRRATTVSVSSPNIPSPQERYFELILGIVPVTLVNERSGKSDKRQTHAEYAGMVLFKNTFEGELPAVEYPKIGVSDLYPTCIKATMS